MAKIPKMISKVGERSKPPTKLERQSLQTLIQWRKRILDTIKENDIGSDRMSIKCVGVFTLTEIEGEINRRLYGKR